MKSKLPKKTTHRATTRRQSPDRKKDALAKIVILVTKFDEHDTLVVLDMVRSISKNVGKPVITIGGYDRPGA
jgi:hypothetical protein